MTLALLVDAGLCVAMVWFAAQAVLARRAGTAVAAFIALGAVTALAWARLRAPDVALAEAALGAGLTGALLMRHLALTGGDDDEGGAS
jgi:uncharacterized MnhB-related membrane protein